MMQVMQGGQHARISIMLLYVKQANVRMAFFLMTPALFVQVSRLWQPFEKIQMITLRTVYPVNKNTLTKSLQ